MTAHLLNNVAAMFVSRNLTFAAHLEGIVILAEHVVRIQKAVVKVVTVAVLMEVVLAQNRRVADALQQTKSSN